MRDRLRPVIACVLLAALAGCGTGAPPTPTATPAATETPTPASTPAVTATSTPSADATFAVRVALVREYDPGTNAGMPTVVTEAEINRTLREHPRLAERLARAFNTSADRPYNRTERNDLYRLVRQYQQTSVTRQANGTWTFYVVDAAGCTIREYSGVYDDGTARNVSMTAETVPC